MPPWMLHGAFSVGAEGEACTNNVAVEDKEVHRIFKKENSMKRCFTITLALVFVFVGATLSQAALKAGTMQLKAGDEVYVCGCGEKCPCLTMSKKPGQCTCAKDLVKGKVSKVAKGKATVMMPDGKEQMFPMKGKYVCACGPKCDCDTVSQAPGKCACGKELKEYGAKAKGAKKAM